MTIIDKQLLLNPPKQHLKLLKLHLKLYMNKHHQLGAYDAIPNKKYWQFSLQAFIQRNHT